MLRYFFFFVLSEKLKGPPPPRFLYVSNLCRVQRKKENKRRILQEKERERGRRR